MFIARVVNYAYRQFILNFGGSDQSEEEQGKETSSSLQNVYSICLHDFVLYPDLKGAYRYFDTLDRMTNAALGDYAGSRLARHVFLDLTRESENPLMQEWINFFKGYPLVEPVSDYIVAAQKIVDYDNLNQEERAMIDLEEKARETWDATLEWAIEEGIEERIEERTKGLREESLAEGREEGERNEARKIAYNLLNKDYSLELISEILMISVEEVSNLLATA